MTFFKLDDFDGSLVNRIQNQAYCFFRKQPKYGKRKSNSDGNVVKPNCFNLDLLNTMLTLNGNNDCIGYRW